MTAARSRLAALLVVHFGAALLGDAAAPAMGDGSQALGADDECEAQPGDASCGVNLAQLRALGRGFAVGADLGGFQSSRATRAFAWGKPTWSIAEAIEASGWEDAHFAEGAGDGAVSRTSLATWVETDLLAAPGPFGESGLATPVPWPASGGDQVGEGQWVAYTRRQVCYIAAKALMGAKMSGYANGLSRYMAGCPRKGDFGHSMVMLLASCSVDPGLADGGQGPLVVVARAGAPPPVAEARAAAEGTPLAAAGLRVCQYDDGAAPLEGLEKVGSGGCSAPTATAAGRDFMTGGLPKQAVQDISAAFLGGYVFGNACGLGGGQDERLMVYFPEVAVLTFFLSQDAQFPQLRQPAWVLGARMFFTGLDGTARFNAPLALDEAVPLESDLVEVELNGASCQVSGSRPFIAFMSENQGYLGAETFPTLQKARSNKLPEQRLAGDEKFAFEKQVRAWYGSVALTSYHSGVRPVLKSLVGSIGTGPWLAGLWWGDSQVGMLAVWIGQAIAAKTWGESATALPLDYYMYADFTENPGNQCFVHSGSNCRACLAKCKSDPLPGSAYWMPRNALVDGKICDMSPRNCGEHGIEDVVKTYAKRTALELWSDAEKAMRGGSMEFTVFDLVMSDAGQADTAEEGKAGEASGTDAAGEAGKGEASADEAAEEAGADEAASADEAEEAGKGDAAGADAAEEAGKGEAPGDDASDKAGADEAAGADAAEEAGKGEAPGDDAADKAGADEAAGADAAEEAAGAGAAEEAGKGETSGPDASEEGEAAGADVTVEEAEGAEEK